MIWGVTPTSIPIGNCSILTEFVWGHTILANGAGQYDWSRSWPASVMPGFYYIQIGNFGFDQNNNFVLVGTEAKLAPVPVTARSARRLQAAQQFVV